MPSEHALLMRVLSALLSYPDEALRDALPEITEALHQSTVLDAPHRDALLALADGLGREALLEGQMRYVELFDHGRSTCLNLFEHVYGDSRERGEAMLALRARYEKCGLSQADYQLPDYLPVMLEYLSCCEPAEADSLIGECAHVLRRLGAALQHRQSAYVAVIAALLQATGQAPLDEGPAVVSREDLDREWEERPAFEKSNEIIASGEG